MKTIYEKDYENSYEIVYDLMSFFAALICIDKVELLVILSAMIVLIPEQG